MPSQTVYAMKRMSRAFIEKYRHEETARREREILGAVDTPFVAKLVASYSGRKCLYLLMDWCEGGELLLQLEHQKNGRFCPETVAFYIAGISVGLMYLHDRGIVFRGVKPENIMLAKDGYPVRERAVHPHTSPGRYHSALTPRSREAFNSPRHQRVSIFLSKTCFETLKTSV